MIKLTSTTTDATEEGVVKLEGILKSPISWGPRRGRCTECDDIHPTQYAAYDCMKVYLEHRLSYDPVLACHLRGGTIGGVTVEGIKDKVLLSETESRKSWANLLAKVANRDAVPMTFACIGSRETPVGEYMVMQEIVRILVDHCGAFVVSGDAKTKKGASLEHRSADQAVNAAEDVKNVTIFKPYHGQKNKKAMAIAKELHPAWDKCNDWVRSAHARNAMIVLGADLKSPVDFVLAYTPKGEAVGGSATAINLAKKHNIPVVNLGKKNIDPSAELQAIRDNYLKSLK